MFSHSIQMIIKKYVPRTKWACPQEVRRQSELDSPMIFSNQSVFNIFRINQHCSLEERATGSTEAPGEIDSIIYCSVIYISKSTCR